MHIGKGKTFHTIFPDYILCSLRFRFIYAVWNLFYDKASLNQQASNWRYGGNLKFCIDQVEIGEDSPVLVIPEIGINHNGSLQIAKEMALAAHEAGAVLIKHQTHVIDDEMSQAAKSVIPGNADESIYDVMSRCALSEEEEEDLKLYVESLGMVFLSTPFSRAAADRLKRMGAKAYKIGSGELNNYPLLEHIASFGKPIIASTGMNSIETVKCAVQILERNQVPYALMHTTNLYPTRSYQVRLGAMQQMMDSFPTIPIGLSDHTTSNNACIAAIALGAKLVERHFVDTMDREGPDVVCSMDKTALGNLLVAADEIPQMLGGKKEPLKEESITSNFAFASVVSTSQILKGEKFTRDNVWVKRPGTGSISAENLNNVLGKKAHVDIASDTQISWEMIE